MQRKIIALLMAAMLMTIVGCGNKENNAQAEIEKEEKKSIKKTVDFFCSFYMCLE